MLNRQCYCSHVVFTIVLQMAEPGDLGFSAALINDEVLTPSTSGQLLLTSTPGTSYATPGPSMSQLPITPLSSSLQQRRSSTRSIKRKKFDDELVESSLIKSDRGRLKTASESKEGTAIPEVLPLPPPEKKRVFLILFKY